MRDLLRDLRVSVRQLGREPRYALVAIATIAVGIAATTTMITVAREVLVAPLAFAHADRLAIVETVQSEDAGGGRRPSRAARPFARVTGGDFVDLGRELKSVEALAYYFNGEVGVQFGDRAAFVPVAWTTGDLFRVFSIVPEAGRLMADAAVDEAVVTDGFAVRMYGSPAAALGHRLSVEDHAYTIVGIVAGRFHYPGDTDLWVSATRVPENLNRTAYNYRAVALAAPGTGLGGAQRELDLVAGRLADAHADTNRGKTFVLQPLGEYLVGDARPTILLLLASVVVLLLIACANVANLQLARGLARGRELAVRAALGAGRHALIRAIVVESAAIGIAGAAVGAALAAAAVTALARWAPAELPRAAEIRVDWLLVGTAAALAFATAIVSALAPARQVLSVDLNDAVREGGERATGRTSLVRQILVGGEIGLAFVLALTAALLVRSLAALDSVDLGFRPADVLVMDAHEPAATSADYDRALDRIDAVMARARALPGVHAVAGAMGLPAGRYGSNGSYAVEGRSRFAPGQHLPEADFTLASPGYFGTMGIRLERGREFSAFDREGSQPVVIVSESVARAQFGGADPLGQRIMCGLDRPEWMTVVGVVADVRHAPASPPGPELYMPLAQHKYRANQLDIVARTAVPAATIAPALQAAAAAVDPDMAVSFSTLDALLHDSVATPRARMALVGLFGVIALLLAASGVYGVMSYTTTQRTREFAVRSALGATRRDVLLLVLGASARLAVPALAAGALAAALAGRALQALLFGVTPLDAPAYATTAAVVLTVTLVAAAVPAWRAAAVEPSDVLK